MGELIKDKKLEKTILRLVLEWSLSIDISSIGFITFNRSRGRTEYGVPYMSPELYLQYMCCGFKFLGDVIESNQNPFPETLAWIRSNGKGYREGF